MQFYEWPYLYSYCLKRINENCSESDAMDELDAMDAADAEAAGGAGEEDDDDCSDAHSAAGEEGAAREGAGHEPDLRDDLSLFADDDDGAATSIVDQFSRARASRGH